MRCMSFRWHVISMLLNYLLQSQHITCIEHIIVCVYIIRSRFRITPVFNWRVEAVRTAHIISHYSVVLQKQHAITLHHRNSITLTPTPLYYHDENKGWNYISHYRYAYSNACSLLSTLIPCAIFFPTHCGISTVISDSLMQYVEDWSYVNLDCTTPLYRTSWSDLSIPCTQILLAFSLSSTRGFIISKAAWTSSYSSMKGICAILASVIILSVFSCMYSATTPELLSP